MKRWVSGCNLFKGDKEIKVYLSERKMIPDLLFCFYHTQPFLSISVADNLETKAAADSDNICSTLCDWLLGEQSLYRLRWAPHSSFFFSPSPYFNLTELAKLDLGRAATCGCSVRVKRWRWTRW